MQTTRIVITDMSQTLQRHNQTLHAVAPEMILHRRLRADKTAQRRKRRRIAALAKAGDIAGFSGDMGHVVGAGADIFCRDIATAEPLQRLTQGFKQRRGFIRFGIAENNAFAAAQRQSGHGIFIGHAARQTQHVIDCRSLVGIVPHAAAAHGRTEAGIVNGNDGFQAGFGFGYENHLLVIVEIGFVKNECRHADGSAHCATSQVG